MFSLNHNFLFVYFKIIFLKNNSDFCFVICKIKNKIDAKNKIVFSKKIYDLYNGNFMMLVYSSNSIDEYMCIYGDPFRYMKITNIEQISETMLKKLSNDKNFILCKI